MLLASLLAFLFVVPGIARAQSRKNVRDQRIPEGRTRSGRADHGYVQAQNLTYSYMIYNVFSHRYGHVSSLQVDHGPYSMYDFHVSMNHNYIVWSDLMKERGQIPP